SAGGKQGGGAVLTKTGKEILSLFRQMEERLAADAADFFPEFEKRLKYNVLSRQASNGNERYSTRLRKAACATTRLVALKQHQTRVLHGTPGWRDRSWPRCGHARGGCNCRAQPPPPRPRRCAWLSRRRCACRPLRTPPVRRSREYHSRR